MSARDGRVRTVECSRAGFADGFYQDISGIRASLLFPDGRDSGRVQRALPLSSGSWPSRSVCATREIPPLSQMSQAGATSIRLATMDERTTDWRAKCGT